MSQLFDQIKELCGNKEIKDCTEYKYKKGT